MESAEDAEVETLIYTADTAVTSVRERDVRNGFRAVRRLNPTLIFSMMQRPLWCWDMWQSGIPSVEALANYPEFGKGILEQASNLSGRLDSSIIWEDMKWLRKVWKKRLVIKGILSSDDAIKAIDHGADAIVVSNHGGRQLDFANSTISILPEIRKAVGKDYDIEVYEAHHRNKKDSPSGTALKLGQLVAKTLGRNFKEVSIFGRKGASDDRDLRTIGFSTVRAGDIVGDHTVIFAGMGERIELSLIHISEPTRLLSISYSGLCV